MCKLNDSKRCFELASAPCCHDGDAIQGNLRDRAPF
jgi:hypothetical protein